VAGACTGGVTSYTWDAQDQLTRIDFPDLTFAEYRYNGLGRRIEKDVNGAVADAVTLGIAIRRRESSSSYHTDLRTVCADPAFDLSLPHARQPPLRDLQITLVVRPRNQFQTAFLSLSMVGS
jgi:hypothetical protein